MVFSYKNVFPKVSLLHMPNTYCRGKINGKTGKTAVLPKYSDSLTLSQPARADYARDMSHLKNPVITHLRVTVHQKVKNIYLKRKMRTKFDVTLLRTKKE
jgi:hypothetical protein